MQKAYQNIVAYGVFLNLGLYRELANYLELCSQMPGEFFIGS